MRLYHRDIGLPTIPERFLTGTFHCLYSRHAQRRKFQKNIELPARLNASDCEIVEVETDDSGEITKIVYRARYSHHADIVIPVIPGTHFYVKTVWLNDRNDQHPTLDVSKYEGGLS